MLLPRLIYHHLRHGDDARFYQMQAEDATDSLPNMPTGQALDLGCGHGVFGRELVRRGWQVVYSDTEKHPDIDGDFFPSDLNTPYWWDHPCDYDLVICSNVLEHLSAPDLFIGHVHRLLRRHGYLYLSFTNWLSPWGGHEFSPWHYLGTELGPWLYDAIIAQPRKHRPFDNLYPTAVGTTLKRLARNHNLRLLWVKPRYYRELAFLARIPWLREFLCWNCAILLQRR